MPRGVTRRPQRRTAGGLAHLASRGPGHLPGPDRCLCRGRPARCPGRRSGSRSLPPLAGPRHLHRAHGRPPPPVPGRTCRRPRRADTEGDGGDPDEPAEPSGRFGQRAREHHALVHSMLEQGHGIRAIARHLAGVGTRYSATPAQPPGRTWSKAPSAHGRANSTPSSPTWTSAGNEDP